MWPMKRPAVQQVRLALPDGSRHDLRNGREPLHRRSSLFSRNRLERPSSTHSVLGTVLLVALALLTVAAFLIADPAGVTLPRAHDARPTTEPFGGNPHAFGLSPSTGAQGAAQVHQIEGLLGRKVDLVNFYLGWNVPGFDTKALDQIEALGALPGGDVGALGLPPRYEPKPLRLVAHNRRRLRRLHTSWARSAAAWGKGRSAALRPRDERQLVPVVCGCQRQYPCSITSTPTGTFTTSSRLRVPTTSCGFGAQTSSIPVSTFVDLPRHQLRQLRRPRRVQLRHKLPRTGGWRSPSAVFVPTLNALKRLAPTKPVLITETASAEQGGKKANWITDLFTLRGAVPRDRRSYGSTT